MMLQQQPVEVTANVSPIVTIMLALISAVLPLASLIIGYLQWRATKASEDAKKILVEQSGTIKEMAVNVNGNLARIKDLADKFAAEVQRVAAGGAPTPYGEPDENNPVTLSAGKPTATGAAGQVKATPTPIPPKA